MPQFAPTAPEMVSSLRNSDGEVIRTDEQLLRQFLSHQGEVAEAAFATLVERYGPIVHRVCRDVLGSSHEAQDAAQAAFLVLARKARSIRKPESLGAWLHGVALRVARHANSEAARRRAAERKKAENMLEFHDPRSASDKFDHAALHDEISRLPEKYRRPIILCYLQEQTQTQAADALGWPLGTVQIRLHRGRERLRSRLASRGAALSALIGGGLMTSSSGVAATLDREWTQATARAAVRFADGRATAGLVDAPVIRLAESVISAMLGDSLKVVAVTAGLVLLGAAFLMFAGAAPNDTKTDVSRPRPDPPASTRSEPGPARSATIKDTGIGKGPSSTPSSPQAARGIPATTAVGAASSAGTGGFVVIPAPPVLLAPGVEPAPSARSTDRAGSLGMVGRESDKKPSGGRELFERIWVKNDRRSHGGDGLGPVFNGQSCVGCHNLGGTGGAGGADQNIDIVIAGGTSGNFASGPGYSYSFSMDFGTGQMEYRIGGDSNAWSSRQAPADPTFLAAIHPGFRDAPGVVLHRYGTDPEYNSWRESVPGRHGSIMMRTSQRNPPTLFGAGLIDKIPDAVIEAAAKRKPSGSQQVKGRVSRLKDGRVGRFGWKAQTATLGDFVRAAAAGEIGLEIPGRAQAADPRLPGVAATGLDMDENECNALADYVRNLPAPVIGQAGDARIVAQVKAGETTFRSIGCTGCHMPKLGDVEGIYSDLLLHDMGEKLGDVDAYAIFVGGPSQAEGAVVNDRLAGTRSASVREWRTPPLWGLRDSGPYLHDGRAATVAQAIALHGGQGATSARRYAELSLRRKQQVDAFLSSLVSPPPDR
jgi:RNA polymerase sigma factor (sigma-70 family)